MEDEDEEDMEYVEGTSQDSSAKSDTNSESEIAEMSEETTPTKPPPNVSTPTASTPKKIILERRENANSPIPKILLRVSREESINLEIDESESPKGIRKFKATSLTKPKNRFILINSDSDDDEDLSPIPSIREESPALDLHLGDTKLDYNVISKTPATVGATGASSIVPKLLSMDPGLANPSLEAATITSAHNNGLPMGEKESTGMDVQVESDGASLFLTAIEQLEAQEVITPVVMEVVLPEVANVPEESIQLRNSVSLMDAEIMDVRISIPSVRPSDSMSVDAPIEMNDTVTEKVKECSYKHIPIASMEHIVIESDGCAAAIDDLKAKSHDTTTMIQEHVVTKREVAESVVHVISDPQPRVMSNEDAIMVLSHPIDDETTGESLDPLLQSEVEPVDVACVQNVDVAIPKENVCELASTVGNEHGRPIIVSVIAETVDVCKEPEETFPEVKVFAEPEPPHVSFGNTSGSSIQDKDRSISLQQDMVAVSELPPVVQDILGGDSELTEIDMISETSVTNTVEVEPHRLLTEDIMNTVTPANPSNIPVAVDLDPIDAATVATTINVEQDPTTAAGEAIQLGAQQSHLNYDDPGQVWNAFRVSHQRGCKPKPTTTPGTEPKKKSRNNKRASESPSARTRNTPRSSAAHLLFSPAKLQDHSSPAPPQLAINSTIKEQEVTNTVLEKELDVPKENPPFEEQKVDPTEVPKIDLSTAILEMDQEIEIEKENDMRNQIRNTNPADLKPIGKLGKSLSHTQVTPERRSNILRDANLVLSDSEANQSPNSSVFGTPLRPDIPEEPQTPSHRFRIKMKRPSFMTKSPLTKVQSVDSSPEPRASPVKFPTDSNGVPIVLSSREHKK
jgi:hypothetical protein